MQRRACGHGCSGDRPLARGQAAARAILARADCPIGSRQRLRVALLAGDDDRAARMLELDPISGTEPWTVKVLGAILALRRGTTPPPAVGRP